MYFERLSWLLYLQSKYTSDKVKLASAIITHCWKTFFFTLNTPNSTSEKNEVSRIRHIFF